MPVAHLFSDLILGTLAAYICCLNTMTEEITATNLDPNS